MSIGWKVRLENPQESSALDLSQRLRSDPRESSDGQILSSPQIGFWFLVLGSQEYGVPWCQEAP